MIAQGLMGKDMNKYSKPKVAELGGAVVFLGFSFGIFAAVFISTYLKFITIDLTILFPGFSTLAMLAFIGIIDNITGWKKGLKQWQHALFPLVAALPLMAIHAGDTIMTLPIIGAVDFGLIFPLIIIPIGIAGASNVFNMLAGFNGLEAGQGLLLTGTLTIIALCTNQIEAAILGIAMMGALLAFLKFNWFPAKIFGGDSLTLMVGGNLAVMSVLGNMEAVGVFLIAVYALEFIIKAKHRFKSECFGIPNKNGALSANPNGGSITQWILKAGKGKMTEIQLVTSILAIQSLVCITALAYFLLK